MSVSAERPALNVNHSEYIQLHLTA